MLISEILENLPNDLERLVYLDTLRKQIEAQEKALKVSVLQLKPKHSRITYVDRKDWKPSPQYKESIDKLEAEKKQLIQESKTKGEGTYVVSTYIKVSPEKAKEPTEIVESPESYSSFFGVNV